MWWNGIKREYESSPEITKEPTNKVIRNKIHFNHKNKTITSTIKIKG